VSGDQPLHPRAVQFDPRRILEVLARHTVQYVLIGGVAARLHGSPLRTDDLDLTPDPAPANLERLVDALQELGAQFRVAGQAEGVPVPLHPAWFHSLTSATFITTAGLLDVVLRPDGLGDYQSLATNASLFDVYGVRIQVAALADIIRSKEASNREKDHAALPTLRALQQIVDEET
jgi:hypothetical protein